MATITLKYNARNRLAQKTIDYVLSLGLFKTTEAKETPGAVLTRKAMEELERGDVVRCKTWDEFLSATGSHA